MRCQHIVEKHHVAALPIKLLRFGYEGCAHFFEEFWLDRLTISVLCVPWQAIFTEQIEHIRMRVGAQCRRMKKVSLVEPQSLTCTRVPRCTLADLPSC